MLKKTISTLLIACGLAASLQGQYDIAKDGTLKIDGSTVFQLHHWSDKWYPNRQRGHEFQFRRENGGKRTLYSGIWNLRGIDRKINLLEIMETGDRNNLRLSYTLKADQPVPTALCAIQIELPAWNNAGKKIGIGGKEVELPENYRTGSLFTANDIEKLRLPLDTGILTISLKKPTRVQLLDVRQFKQEMFSLRLLFPETTPRLKQSSQEISLKFEPYKFETLDLKQSANMGFRDEIAGDRKGGWTDQGPSNDLRILKPGKLSANPLSFTILDPSKNGGKSCIVLAGGDRMYFPRSASLDLNGKSIGTLFLLHAIAWPPKNPEVIGDITFEYTDGTTFRQEVKSERDVGNWWMPSAKPNATLVWNEFNNESPVGLYMSRFELPARPLKRLLFRSNGKSVWLITAATASPQKVVLPVRKEKKHIVMRNADWRVVDTDRFVEKGSALDFSFLLDAPAGKYGRIKVTPNGHFEFEKLPGKQQRFYGANIAFWANFLSKKEAELIAERLARIGYNAIRLHHFDRDLIQKNAADSATLDPKQLDKLDYLVFCLKKQGIYITLDLFTTRPVKKNEFKTLPGFRGDYKLAAMINREVADNLKKFSASLLNHVNPYTGFAWKEDPVFIGLSLINENTILHNIRNASPYLKNLYDAEFQKWCISKKVTITEKNKNSEYRRFLLDVYRKSWEERAAFVRELGVKMPLTDQNYISMPNTAIQRASYDYVDNHIYWDHPQFLGKAWSLPTQLNNCSVLAVRMRVPKVIAPTRIFGKPFTVTEFDFCYPNNYRAEGAPIFGAYAAMQDWDAIYRFAYSHSAVNMLGDKPLIPAFDVVNDPPRLLGERIGMAFFLRGDIRASDEKFAAEIPESSWKDPFLFDYPEWFCDLMLFGQVGSLSPRENGTFSIPPKAHLFDLWKNNSAEKFLGKLLSDKILTSREADLKNRIYRSSTGELTADFKKQTFTALNQRSEALVIPGGKSVSGHRLAVKTDRNFCVASAIALDNRTLADSRRILLLHLTDVKVEKTEFSSEKMQILLKEGDGPVLARRGRADFSLKLDRPPKKLYALDCSGRRLKEIPFKHTNGTLLFTADTFCADKIVFAYELLP